MTCRLGEQLAEELIEQYKAEHNGECPPKVTINLWAVECIRNEGTMEAQALSLLGVRPVYNASNQVIGLELIPQHELKRPRVDVVFAPSGLYRDIFPELMALLDKAVSLARSADEKDNFVREHILESEDKLKQLGVQEDSLARASLRYVCLRPLRVLMAPGLVGRCRLREPGRMKRTWRKFILTR